MLSWATTRFLSRQVVQNPQLCAKDPKQGLVAAGTEGSLEPCRMWRIRWIQSIIRKS